MVYLAFSFGSPQNGSGGLEAVPGLSAFWPGTPSQGSLIVKYILNYEANPRTGRNASRNRPYSPGTLDTYKTYYKTHIKDDPFAELLMSEVDEEDVMAFTNRLSVKRLRTGKPMAGSRTFTGTIIFLRMVFREYRRKNKRWLNPFQDLDPPSQNSVPWDALLEERGISLRYIQEMLGHYDLKTTRGYINT
jgi:site-specific recombinase XerD